MQQHCAVASAALNAKRTVPGNVVYSDVNQRVADSKIQRVHVTLTFDLSVRKTWTTVTRPTRTFYPNLKFLLSSELDLWTVGQTAPCRSTAKYHVNKIAIIRTNWLQAFFKPHRSWKIAYKITDW